MSTGTSIGPHLGEVPVHDSVEYACCTFPSEFHVPGALKIITAATAIHSIPTTGESAFKCTGTGHVECALTSAVKLTNPSLSAVLFPARSPLKSMVPIARSTGIDVIEENKAMEEETKVTAKEGPDAGEA